MVRSKAAQAKRKRLEADGASAPPPRSSVAPIANEKAVSSGSTAATCALTFV